jgi:hypothetical protein
MEIKQRVQAKLKENPETSNRAIGAELNVNDKLVGRIRNELEKKEQIPVVTHTRGLDGRLHPRKRIGKSRRKTIQIFSVLHDPDTHKNGLRSETADQSWDNYEQPSQGTHWHL